VKQGVCWGPALWHVVGEGLSSALGDRGACRQSTIPQGMSSPFDLVLCRCLLMNVQACVGVSVS
jgi:hypothetical protein